MFHEGHSAADILGHIFLGSVFISQGLGTALSKPRFANHAGKLAEKGIPYSNVVLACGLAMMLCGGAMVIADIYTRIGAWLLLIFSLVATVLYQAFWTIEDPGRRRERRGAFFNNLAIIGGLLLLLR